MAVAHPMLAALMIWAFAHLLTNGDLASVLLFGSFLVYAAYDRLSVSGRPSPGPPPSCSRSWRSTSRSSPRTP